MPFRFKFFEVEDDLSTLRVGTDAMLLGAWAEPGKARNILDIGTGCGVLALMMAQKSEADILAIDPDPSSIEQAGHNFASSNWSKQLTATQISLQEFVVLSNKTFDFIITNPPFFSGSLKSPLDRKNMARHEIEMSHSDLLLGISEIINPDGKLSLILPAAMGNAFEKSAEQTGLFLSRSMLVSSREEHPPKRVLLEFTAGKARSPEKKTMFILDKTNSFSNFYLSMTREFHQF